MPKSTRFPVQHFVWSSYDSLHPEERLRLPGRAGRRKTAERGRDPLSVLALIFLAALSILAWIQIGLAQAPS